VEVVVEGASLPGGWPVSLDEQQVHAAGERLVGLQQPVGDASPDIREIVGVIGPER
jgi:hypothetical protein